MASELFVDNITGKTGTSGSAPITLSGNAATLGSAVTVGAGSGILNKISSSTSSSAQALVAFDNTTITTSHKYYMIVMNYMRPTTNARNLLMGLSVDNGSSFISGFYGRTDYYQLDTSSGGVGQEAFQDQSYHLLFTNAGNAADVGTAGVIHLYGSQNTNSTNVKIVADAIGKHSTDNHNFRSFSKSAKTETATINYIKLYYSSSDTVAEHDVSLYGVS